MAHVVDSRNFDSIISTENVAVVDFWAPWCSPCRMLGPVIDELAAVFEGRAFVGKCNVDDEQELAMRFGIMTIPCVIIFKGGKPVQTIVGLRQKEEYENAVNSLI